MGFQRRIASRTAPLVEDLRRRLADEWRSGDQSGRQPVIMEERGKEPGSVALCVAWDDWGSLTPQERAGIIADAYAEVRGREQAARVHHALGLTVGEANAVGIYWM